MEQIISDVLAHSKKKRLILDSVFNITKDIESLFNCNDALGAEQALDSRMELIQEAIGCDEAIGKALDRAELPRALKLEKIMRLDIEGMELAPEEKALLEVYQTIKSIVDKTIKVDQRFSVKLIGKSSIYSEME